MRERLFKIIAPVFVGDDVNLTSIRSRKHPRQHVVVVRLEDPLGEAILDDVGNCKRVEPLYDDLLFGDARRRLAHESYQEVDEDDGNHEDVDDVHDVENALAMHARRRQVDHVEHDAEESVKRRPESVEILHTPLLRVCVDEDLERVDERDDHE